MPRHGELSGTAVAISSDRHLDRPPYCGHDALAQLSYRYASDSRNAPENCGLLRPLSICGAKNHCPFRGHLALTGSTLMCWRRCSRNAVRTVGRRKSRLDHRFSLGALQSELPPPWHVWCLNRSAPHNALISSHIFSSGGKVGLGSSDREDGFRERWSQPLVLPNRLPNCS